MSPRRVALAAVRAGLVLAVATAAFAGCGDGARPHGGVDPASLPDTPVALDLGREPLVNPLNLWEMMIEGSPDHESVGRIGAHRVTTRELDLASDRLLTRIGDRIYLARDRGWLALLEEEGLARAAAAAAVDVPTLLARAYADLPTPRREHLRPLLDHPELAELPAAARRDAARTLWRYQRWQARRSRLVADGLAGVPRERAQLMLVNPAFAAPATAVGKIGDRVITRAELHLAAGYAEQLGRREYHQALVMLFEAATRDRLLEGAAAAAGLTPAALVARERAALGPPPEDEVARFVAEHPAYARERERAVDAVRTLREVAAVDALLARLASEAGVELLVREPPIEPIRPAVLAPRRAGAATAPHLIEILHCVGGPTCAQGAALVRSIVEVHGDRARIELGDYFAGFDLARLRHAIALRCADEQGDSVTLLARLLDGAGRATTDDLIAAARAAGLRERPFRACLDADRHLERVVENNRRADQLGLELNILGVWVNGHRVDRLGDPAHVRATIESALR